MQYRQVTSLLIVLLLFCCKDGTIRNTWSGHWRLTSASPNSFVSGAHFQVGGDFYSGLGCYTCSGCTYLNVTCLAKFDPLLEKWSGQTVSHDVLPSDIFYFSIGDKAYVGAGRYCKDVASFAPRVFMFEPVPGSWTRLPDLSVADQWKGFSFNGRGYIFGHFSEQVLEFEPETQLWKEFNPFPGLPIHSSFSITGKEYVLMSDGELWEFEPMESQWLKKKPYPVKPTDNNYAFLLEEKIYVGNDDLFWSYDPLRNVWTQLPAYPGDLSSTLIGFDSGGKGFVQSTIYDTDQTTKHQLYEFVIR